MIVKTIKTCADWKVNNAFFNSQIRSRKSYSLLQNKYSLKIPPPPFQFLHFWQGHKSFNNSLIKKTVLMRRVAPIGWIGKTLPNARMLAGVYSSWSIGRATRSLRFSGLGFSCRTLLAAGCCLSLIIQESREKYRHLFTPR